MRTWKDLVASPHWAEDYDDPVCRRYWSDLFDTKNGPSAKAYHLLTPIDVGPDRNSARGPLHKFHEGDAHPGDNSVWVNAKDKLSVSLLQPRLIDLGIPIKIVEGD